MATSADYTSTYDDLSKTVVPAAGIAGGAKARKAAIGAKDKGDLGVSKGYGGQGVFASGTERIVYDSAGKKF